MTVITRQIDVSVTDKGVERGKRTVTILIEAKQDLFQLSDLLVKEAVVAKLENVLKKAIKGAVAEYIASGRKVVRGVNGTGGSKNKQRKVIGGQDKRTGAKPPDSRV